MANVKKATQAIMGFVKLLTIVNKEFVQAIIDIAEYKKATVATYKSAKSGISYKTYTFCTKFCVSRRTTKEVKPKGKCANFSKYGNVWYVKLDETQYKSTLTWATNVNAKVVCVWTNQKYVTKG